MDNNTLKINFIMCPYAGGSAAGYFTPFYNMESNVEMIPVEYVGHGSRYSEAQPGNFSALLNDAYTQVLKHTTKGDFVLFGHSMGGMIAACMADRLYQENGNNMKALVISSCLPPDIFSQTARANMSVAELEEYLSETRKISSDMLNDEFFREIIFNVDERTPENAMSLAEEVRKLRKEIKEFEKENKRLNELNEFLEEASAFFAASRQRSAKKKE